MLTHSIDHTHDLMIITCKVVPFLLIALGSSWIHFLGEYTQFIMDTRTMLELTK